MRQETINSKVQARLASLREPHKGMIYPTGTMLQSATGEELRPFREAGRKLTLSPSAVSGMVSVLNIVFKGEFGKMGIKTYMG